METAALFIVHAHIIAHAKIEVTINEDNPITREGNSRHPAAKHRKHYRKTMTAQQENDTPQTNLPGHTAFKIHLSLQTSVNVVKIFRRTVFFY